MENETRSPLVGWRERVDLPLWGVVGLRAKIDTGARTSAIHASSVEEVAPGRVRFELVLRERPSRRATWVEAEIERRSVVKSSNGIRQIRYVCRTVLRLGGREHSVEIALACRKGMLCTMLIGRRALAGYYHVDPGRKYLASDVRARARRVKKPQAPPAPPDA